MKYVRWSRTTPEEWGKRVRELKTTRSIRAHVACIVWWDLSEHADVPKDWCIDLREQYDDSACEDLSLLEKALVDCGYPEAVAHRRAFKDVWAGKLPKRPKPAAGAPRPGSAASSGESCPQEGCAGRPR